MSLISVVIPVYCNAESLGDLWNRLSGVASANPGHDFEFVFVDDGSPDNSFDVLGQLAQRDNRICIVKLTRNFGSVQAVVAGIRQATGDCVAMITADLQEPPETLTEMIRHWNSGFRVVLAVRRDRHGDPVSTRVFASIFNYLFGKFVVRGIPPQGIGFFAIDRQVVTTLFRDNERDLHLGALLLWSGFPHEIVQYDRALRPHGKSKWTFVKKVNHFFDSLIGFSYIPLRVLSGLGILLASVGVLYAIVIVVNRLISKTIVTGWATLAVLILVTAGSQLVMLGVIGEYLARDLDATRRRPLFVVDRILRAHEAGRQDK